MTERKESLGIVIVSGDEKRPTVEFVDAYKIVHSLLT